MKTICVIGLMLLLPVMAQAATSSHPGQTGAIEGTITDAQGGDVIRYAGLVPPRLPSHRLFGLILGLHGKGGDEKQQVGPISQALAANNLAGQYVVLGLKAKGESWEDADVQPVAEAIAWALKEYPIDSRRVYAWGFSSGAFFTGKFAPRHQNLLAAGVIQSGGLWDPPKLEDGAEAAVQLYIIHGEKDTMVDVKMAHDACARLKAANYRFVYHELTGDDHGLRGPGGQPARQDAIRFMNALRNRAIPLTDAERKIVDDLSAKLSSGKWNPPTSAYAPLLNLAGPETDALLVVALQSAKPTVRLNAASLCQQRLYGKPVLDALAVAMKDKDAKVRSLAIRGLGLAANFQNPDAIEALAAFAKDTTNGSTDRLDAAGQLGVTLPLQLLSVNRQSQTFTALKALVDDKNSQISELASVSLDGKLTFDGQTYRAEK
ncbi:MAG TPA: HEAT repeat domain-containing protein [Tepidisphaeraceae bacterium]|jgi:predicted esterase|nr:HEAT repeat domain-containing protein [Tepidisphaeraceae bacterium]